MGERDWQVNGPDAWPTSEPIGRKPGLIGHSKIAVLGPALRVGGQAGKGMLGRAGGKALNWLGKATGVSPAAGANPVASAARRGITGAGVAGGGNVALKEMGVDTGLNTADAAAAGATLGFLGRGAPGKGPIAGRLSNVKGLGSELRPLGPRGSAGMGALDRAAVGAAARGGTGYGAGAAGDIAFDLATEKVPGGTNPLTGESYPGTRSPNLRGTFGTAGLMSGGLSAVPGYTGGVASAIPTLGGMAKAYPDIQSNVFAPGAAQEAIIQGKDRAADKGVEMFRENKGLSGMASTLGAGETPEDQYRSFASGKMEQLAGEADPRTLGAGVLGAKGYGKMEDGVWQLSEEGLDQAAPELIGWAKSKIAKERGIAPEAVTMAMLKEYQAKAADQLQTIDKYMGDDSIIGKLLQFVGGLNFTQKWLVGGAVVAGIVGIVTALAGKGSASAISLLAALGMGAWAYGTNPKPFKGLVGLGQPGDTAGATAAAEGAGTQTPEQLDESAEEAGVLPKGTAQQSAPASNPTPQADADQRRRLQSEEYTRRAQDVLRRQTEEAASAQAK